MNKYIPLNIEFKEDINDFVMTLYNKNPTLFDYTFYSSSNIPEKTSRLLSFPICTSIPSVLFINEEGVYELDSMQTYIINIQMVLHSKYLENVFLVCSLVNEKNTIITSSKEFTLYTEEQQINITFVISNISTFMLSLDIISNTPFHVEIDVLNTFLEVSQIPNIKESKQERLSMGIMCHCKTKHTKVYMDINQSNVTLTCYDLFKNKYNYDVYFIDIHDGCTTWEDILYEIEIRQKPKLQFLYSMYCPITLLFTDFRYNTLDIIINIFTIGPKLLMINGDIIIPFAPIFIKNEDESIQIVQQYVTYFNDLLEDVYFEINFSNRFQYYVDIYDNNSFIPFLFFNRSDKEVYKYLILTLRTKS